MKEHKHLGAYGIIIKDDNLKFGIITVDLTDIIAPNGEQLYKGFKKSAENCKGKVAYNEDILISIVGLSISSVDGVKVKYKKNDKSKLEGVKILSDKDGIHVDVTVDLYYGYNIPEVAYFIQQNIKHNVESMSKFKIASVDVHVDSVEFNDEANKN